MSPDINVLVAAGAAIIPMLIGAIYYGSLFGRQWMDSLGFEESNIPEPIKMPLVFGISYVLSFVLAYTLGYIIDHTHRGINDAGEMYFSSHYTFGHGMVHGLQVALILVIPVLVSNLLFQRNTGKNILLNVVYWCLTLSLMAGVMDKFA